MTAKKIPQLDLIKAAIATVERCTGKTFQDHLAFGDTDSHTLIGLYQGYFGEFNSNNDRHGRGLEITSEGDVKIK